MAEIQTSSSSKHIRSEKTDKKSTRVDLMPMVDLGFLLITFFVFTSALSKPKVMDLVMPMDSDIPTPICRSCVLTVILDKDNTVKYYEGMPEDIPVIKETSFTVEGIRTVLIKKGRQ